MIEPSKRIRLLIAYDGTNYKGWQKQPNQTAVQNVLEKTLQTILQTEIKTSGSGRTDSGVHAFAQNIHFDWPENKKLPLKDYDLPYYLNSLLPDDIVVKKAWIVESSFNALHSAIEKHYEYKITNSPTPCPIENNRSWWISTKSKGNLNLSYLKELSSLIIGTHDFKSFQSAGTEVPHTTREVFNSFWTQDRDSFIYQVKGKGFLKQMVRNLVGTFIKLSWNGDSKTIEDLKYDFQKIIDQKDRTLAAAPAPAHGLYLKNVSYPEELLKNSIPLF